jgi:UDP-glucose 6-dehydrogenase
MARNDKVCVLGMGFIGLTLAATLAEAGNDVFGVDVIPEVVDSLRAKKCYFFEPGLTESVKKYGGKNLTFSTSISDSSCNYFHVTTM